MSSSGKPLTTQEIDAIETLVRHPLPQEYRDFLLAHNGGRPRPDAFRFHEPRSRSLLMAGSDCPWDGPAHMGMVDWFLMVGDSAGDNIERFMKVYLERIPPNMVAVAHDPGGNLICLSVDGPDPGAVYFWDHDEEAEEGETPDYRNMYFIAHSFSEFLNGLIE